MHKRMIFFISLFSLIGFASSVFAESTSAKYRIDLQLPYAMQWRLADNQQDATGYIQTFIPKGSRKIAGQSLNFNYGKGVKMPLQESMKEVLSVMAGTDCKRKSSSVIQQKSNYLVFTTLLDKCSNGKALQQIFKVFNMPDGQYAVIYVADPHHVPSKTIHTMHAIVMSAKIKSL